VSLLPRLRFPARLLAPLAAAVLAAAPVAAPSRAQAPHEAWRTLELPRFRVHYPAASEAWALRTAARLEAIRDRLEAEIGFAPAEVVDVVVADPLSRPNGTAWPFLAGPRMVLWTSPPEPASVLGSYRDWGELVAVHEDAHLVHLLRPSRNPGRRALARLLPAGGVGPISTRAPRWVTEGYATLLEGRLTASGRPNSDLRSAILRQRARAGRLPGYRALGSGDESWLGRSMAYLAGSAYLEWLEGRPAPPAGAEPDGASGGSPREGALRDLWARLTARRSRSFDEAFRGVFGASPGELYGRFTAELTWRAMEAERLLREGGAGGPLGEGAGPGGERAGEPGTGRGAGQGGELWQDLSWSTGAPALAPDGSRIAVVLRHREDPPRLVVWETGPDEAAEERWREERERVAAADPEDVPAVRVGPLPREPVATLPTFGGREPMEPRWSPDGDSLLFTALGPDREGFLRADLYRWTPATGAVERLTRWADLRSADPIPSLAGAAGRAVAVRNRHGFSQLVAVDLATGSVAPLTEPSVEVVWATPRVSPDGRRLAAVRHRDGAWRLVVVELAAAGGGGLALGEPRELPTPAGATVADPAWGPGGGTLYAAVGEGGFIDAWAFDLEDDAGAAAGRRLTRTLGAALAPEPTPDGAALFYLSLEHDGLELWRMELGEASRGASDLRAGAAAGAVQGAPPAARSDLPAELAPAIRPPPPPPAAPFTEAALPPPRPYGAGPQALTPLLGVALAPSGLALEAGVRGGDVVGRLDWFLLGSAGNAGAIEGGVLAAAWRGLPVELSAALFAASEEPARQDTPPPPGAGAVFGPLDRETTGLALAAAWDRRFPAGAVGARLGLFGAEVEPLGPLGGERRGPLDTAAATLRAGLVWAPSRGRLALPLELAGAFQEGETDSEGWRRWGLRAGAGIERGEAGLRLSWQRHGSQDALFAFDRFHLGGVRRSLLPEDADFARIPAPALPSGYLTGEEHEAQRLELSLEALPAPLFYERHRVRSDFGGESDWLSLAGIELEGSLPPLPIVALPAARFTAGAAYVLEDPAGDLQDEVRLWAAVAWRP
jgi:Tol biopolymer transport system component